MTEKNKKQQIVPENRPMLGETVEIPVLRLGVNGEGIADCNGFTLFIDGVLPGEKVRVRISELHTTYGRAKLLDVLIPVEHRRRPDCKIFGRCGGCQLMHLRYREQTANKRIRVQEDIRRIGGFADFEVEPCIAADNEFAYRNKIEVPFRVRNRAPWFGFFRSNSHEIIPFRECLIHCKAGDHLFNTLRELILRSGIHPYDEKRDLPSLRHVLLRNAREGALVTLVTNGMDIRGIEALAKELMASDPMVKGVVQNNNTSRSNVILGREQRLLAGVDHVIEEVAGIRFRIGSRSFFQINTPQAARMAQLVLEMAALDGTETVLDAYSGVGFFSMFLAQKALKVIGIESFEAATLEARSNAEMNGLLNVEFRSGAAEELIASVQKADVVVMDPPRKGCEASFLEALSGLAPKKIIYVSCNPATLARDLKILASRGYRLTRVKPVDMFPQTSHIESVSLLERIQ